MVNMKEGLHPSYVERPAEKACLAVSAVPQSPDHECDTHIRPHLDSPPCPPLYRGPHRSGKRARHGGAPPLLHKRRLYHHTRPYGSRPCRPYIHQGEKRRENIKNDRAGNGKEPDAPGANSAVNQPSTGAVTAQKHLPHCVIYVIIHKFSLQCTTPG